MRFSGCVSFMFFVLHLSSSCCMCGIVVSVNNTFSSSRYVNCMNIDVGSFDLMVAHRIHACTGYTGGASAVD